MFGSVASSVQYVDYTRGTTSVGGASGKTRWSAEWTAHKKLPRPMAISLQAHVRFATSAARARAEAELAAQPGVTARPLSFSEELAYWKRIHELKAAREAKKAARQGGAAAAAAPSPSPAPAPTPMATATPTPMPAALALAPAPPSATDAAEKPAAARSRKRKAPADRPAASAKRVHVRFDDDDDGDGAGGSTGADA